MNWRATGRPTSLWKVWICILLGLILLGRPHPASSADNPRFETALENGIRAREALREAHRFLLKWAARKDKQTALIRSGPKSDRWTVRGTATRLYPQMVLSAYLTDQTLFNGLLRQTLRDEIRLTSRLTRLPDNFDLTAGRFFHGLIDTDRILTSASGYAAEGLSAITEVVGPDAWSARMQAIVDDLFARAAVRTPYSNGPLPSGSAEINGNLLRLLPRLADQTGNPAYLEWARRIGDAYCLGVLPRNGGLPAHRWDFNAERAQNAALSLNSAGYPIIEGLILLYAVEAARGSDRALIYRPTLAHMLNVLLSHTRSPEGLFYARIEPDRRGGYAVNRKNRSSTWPQLLASCLLFGQISGNTTYSEPVYEILRTLPKIHARAWGDRPDIAARDIPGILSLLARARSSLMPADTAAYTAALTWVDERMETLLKSTPSSPRSENSEAAFARAALSYAWFKTAGIRLDPWREDLACGATVAGDTLYLALRSDLPWQGRFAFDIPRHQEHNGFAEPYPFNHGFPERFPIQSDAYYTIHISGAGGSATWAGSLLREGLQITLKLGEPHHIRITKVQEISPPQPVDVGDSLRID